MNLGKNKPDNRRNVSRLPARGVARLGAVQALYQMDIAATDANQVVSEFLDQRLSELATEMGADEVDESHFRDIVLGVVREQQQIDPALDTHLAEGWRLPRIDSILRAILRSAAYELFHVKDVPARVIINEYVDIAHVFFGTEEPGVVNGILDHLARETRPDEFQLERDG